MYRVEGVPDGWELSQGGIDHQSLPRAKATAIWLAAVELGRGQRWEYDAVTLDDGRHRVIRRRAAAGPAAPGAPAAPTVGRTVGPETEVAGPPARPDGAAPDAPVRRIRKHSSRRRTRRRR